MIEILVTHAQVRIIHSPEFQIFAKKQNIMLAGPEPSSRTDEYIYKVGRKGYGYQNPIHEEAKKDVINWFCQIVNAHKVDDQST